MDIIFQGNHNAEEAAESLKNVIKLFKDRYQIQGFREMHLTVTLMDETGEDVELVDSETEQVYRTFEVYREGCELERPSVVPILKLVVDNTR